MQTRNAFVNNESDFGPGEAMEAAIDKRAVLWKLSNVKEQGHFSNNDDNK